MDSINNKTDSELDSSKDEMSVTSPYSTASSSPSSERCEVHKQIYWLCGFMQLMSDEPILPNGFFPIALFEDRTTSLLYAYSLSVCPADPEGFEYIIGSIRGKDERNPSLSGDTSEAHFLNYQNFLTVGGKSLHFFANPQGDKHLYLIVIPVEVTLTAEGSAVEFSIKVVRLRQLWKVQYVISEARRVDNILNSQKNETARTSYWLAGNQINIETFLCTMKIISSILPCPPRLHLEPNIYEQRSLSKCEHVEGLYRPDIISQLHDILTKLFRKVNVNRSHIPLQGIERIASFLSIENVVAIIHLDYPDGLFDPRVIMADIIICFPNVVAPLPLEYLFQDPAKNLRACFRKFISGELPKNSEEFWILLNESMVSPCAYRKNDIKTDGRSELSFIIPTRQQEGVDENAIRKIESFLFEENSLYENQKFKILTVNEFDKVKLHFEASLIEASICRDGGSCYHVNYQNHNSVTAALPIDLQKFEVLMHMHEEICSGEVTMLTDDSRGEKLLTGVEPHCNIGRSRKSSSDEESDFAITRQNDLIISLANSLNSFWDSVRLDGDVPSVFLPRSWKIIADTFGISNYSIIGSEDEPCPVPTDLVVLIHSEEWPDPDPDFFLLAASVKCIRNNKLTIASQCVNQKGDQNKYSVPPDDETVHDLKISVLTWDTDSTGTWRVWAERATASLSASGKVLHWSQKSSDYFQSDDPSSEELNIFFASLKCSRLQVQFLMHDS